jgi:ribonuclease MRP protein subunit RMP1
VLMAILGHVCRVFGLISVYDELGVEETRKAIEEFAAEGWGDDEGLGVLVLREAEKNEDFGEILAREDGEDEDAEVMTKARATETELRKTESACLAPERDMLEESRRALRAMATGSTPVTSSRESSMLPPTKTRASKKLKSTEPDSKPKLTKVLPAVNWDDNSTAPVPKAASKTTTKPSERIPSTSTTSSKLKKKRPKQDDGDAINSAARPIKKKKKKKKNAIDDLFAGL